jgi:RimJ/RimL family protein N-acetyltransferase
MEPAFSVLDRDRIAMDKALRHNGDHLEVTTGRLRLVALDPELARLEDTDRAAFFDALGAQFESAWPPVAIDAPDLAGRLEALSRRPHEAGWGGWIILMGWTPGGPDRAVGIGGFFGPPDQNGEIEIGYAMLPSFREQGLATEAVEGLLGWALEDERVKAVRAHTLAHLYASRRVLEKTGFAAAPGAEDAAGDETVRYDYVKDAAA